MVSAPQSRSCAATGAGDRIGGTAAAAASTAAAVVPGSCCGVLFRILFEVTVTEEVRFVPSTPPSQRPRVLNGPRLLSPPATS